MRKVWLFVGSLLMATLIFAQQPVVRQPRRSQEPTVLERAKKWAQMGNWVEVRRELEPHVKKQPNDLEVRKLLAEALLQIGEFKKALPHLRWLTLKSPKDPYVWSALGQVQERLNQKRDAKESLRKAVHLNPNEPEFRIHLSRILIELDRWDDAAHHLRWLAHRMPHLASVQYHLALYHERKGNFRKALHHAKRTVQLSPKEPEARLTLARIALKLNDAKTAAEQVEVLTKWFPTNADLAMECASLFAQVGDDERAAKYFRRVLHLQPDNPDAHRALVELYSQRGEWAKALWHLRWLSRRFPSDSEIARKEALCYVRMRRYRDAERSLLRWAEHHPDDFEPFVHLARLYRDLGSGVKARAAYIQALRRRPPVEVIVEAADLEEKLENFKRAAELYGWAQRRQPNNPRWRALKAEALMKAGLFDRAGRVLRFALKSFPSDRSLNALMGIWLARRVEWVEAEQFLRQSIEQGGRGGSVAESVGAHSLPTELFLNAVGTLVEILLCQGRAKEAVQICDRLLRRHPSPELLIWWAQGMEELGKGREAAERLERSQLFARGEERVARTAAQLWELANEPEKAAALWERFAQIVPGERAKLSALLNAARVLERANAISKALAVLEKAQRVANKPLLRAERIHLMLKADAPAAALNEAEKLLVQFPKDLTAANLYAEAALQLWGETAFERVAERFRSNTKLVGAFWAIAHRLNRLENALGTVKPILPKLSPVDRKIIQFWLTNALETSGIQSPPQTPELLFESAREAAERDQLRKAVELCRKVIAMRRDFLPAYQLLLQLYRKQDDLEHAVKGFTRMANRNRNDLPLNFAAAIALSLSGQYRRAIAYWRRVCALTNNEPTIMLKLAENLEKAHEDVQAQWVRKFVERMNKWEGLANETH